MKWGGGSEPCPLTHWALPPPWLLLSRNFLSAFSVPWQRTWLSQAFPRKLLRPVPPRGLKIWVSSSPVHDWQWRWTCQFEQCTYASVRWVGGAIQRGPGSPGRASNMPGAHGYRSFLSGPLRWLGAVWKSKYLARNCLSQPHQKLGLNNTGRETNKQK